MLDLVCDLVTSLVHMTEWSRSLVRWTMFVPSYRSRCVLFMMKTVTPVVWVMSPSYCFQVSTTTDGLDADLWKDGLFKSKVTRYLCFTRVFSKENVSQVSSEEQMSVKTRCSQSHCGLIPKLYTVSVFMDLEPPICLFACFPAEPLGQCSSGHEAN